MTDLYRGITIFDVPCLRLRGAESVIQRREIAACVLYINRLCEESSDPSMI